MKVAYFVHELEDPAVRRRVRMLKAGGATTALFGFERGRYAAQPVGDEPPVTLGRTTGHKLISRIGSVLLAVPRAWARRDRWAGADVIIARNLEMLTVVSLAAAVARPRGRLVYECLDIHRLMLSPGLPGKALRAIERQLLRRVDLVLTSSPAFTERYFRSVQGRDGAAIVVENKVLALDGAPSARASTDGPSNAAPAPTAAAGPGSAPWRIAWCGVLRCRRSFEVLRQVAAALGGRLEVDLWGTPDLEVFPDLAADAEDAPHVTFRGRYTLEDLPSIYGAAHFAWAIDYYEAGGNSDWLLPNRLYESLRYGVVPIAVAGVETARWLRARGVGVVLDAPLAESLKTFLEGDAAERFASLRAAAGGLPADATTTTAAECRALVATLAGRDNGRDAA